MQYNNGVADTAAGFSSSPCLNSTSTAVLYPNGPDTICGKMAVMFRGYIYASTTGVYNFSSTGVDDGAYYWIGAPAKSGWTVSNAAIKVLVGNQFGSATYTAPIEGTYIPYRIILVNVGPGVNTGSGFSMTVANPYGALIDIGSRSLNVVQYSCDGRSGPMFTPAMGKET